MDWRALDEMLQGWSPPVGYRVEQLARVDIPEVTERLRAWYPDICVGTESRHLEAGFYEREFFLRGEDPARSLVGLLCRPRDGHELVAMMTLERNARGRQISSPMGAVEPSSRGIGLGHIGTVMLETVGRNIGAEVAYYFATLKVARTQRNAERHGFTLVGIVPAFDQDAVAPGTVRRVYEGLYAKVLADPARIQLPAWEAMIPSTRALYRHLFGPHPDDPDQAATISVSSKVGT